MLPITLPITLRVTVTSPPRQSPKPWWPHKLARLHSYEGGEDRGMGWDEMTGIGLGWRGSYSGRGCLGRGCWHCWGGRRRYHELGRVGGGSEVMEGGNTSRNRGPSGGASPSRPTSESCHAEQRAEAAQPPLPCGDSSGHGAAARTTAVGKREWTVQGQRQAKPSRS